MTAANFASYCVTTPVDPGLPGGGGQQVCGFYDVNPALVTQVSNVVKLAPQLEEIYNGLDVSTNVRLAGGVTVSGGLSVGRTRLNTCFATTDPSIQFPDARNVLTTGGQSGPASPTAIAPRTSAFCDVRPPFQPNVKFVVVYPLPWGFQTSATYQRPAGATDHRHEGVHERPDCAVART